MDIIYKV